ncbi:hypothetical protein H6G81_34655 [Scytonema hofmannii FACHB-248]|uniref:Uncharacterized protein n=1 Tax=Scytonema hofmannii FACHB-248 TaxID=1842502 RepID=A0ABR8H376_9CYAN|nr:MULTISPECIES: hypothetical protein [Nostocales]MBD2609493.1 hypothetical protein [Scytonema hofmannii FACHB-248]
MTNQAATRLLLALWELGGAKQEVNKGKLHDRIKSKEKKIADFKDIFEDLEKKGAIAISKKGYTLASPQGLAVLSEGLKSGDFKFEGTIVGTWAANALIKWIGEMDGADVPVNGVKSEIKSYDEFEKVTLEVYDKLNRDYNLNDLVPIYRIRREIGDRASRDHFSDWLLEMQANDILQLMAGEMPDITPDKRDDSITIPGGGLRYYAKHLS